MKRLIVIGMGVCLIITTLIAGQPPQFETAQQAAHYQALVKTLRCVTCQNQNLAESNAPVAVAMRDEIVRQLKAGQSPVAIEDFMVARYGDFVLYHPRMNAHTWILWLGPLFMGVCAIFIMVRMIRKQKERDNG